MYVGTGIIAVSTILKSDAKQSVDIQELLLEEENGLLVFRGMFPSSQRIRLTIDTAHAHMFVNKQSTIISLWQLFRFTQTPQEHQ